MFSSTSPLLRRAVFGSGAATLAVSIGSHPFRAQAELPPPDEPDKGRGPPSQPTPFLDAVRGLVDDPEDAEDNPFRDSFVRYSVYLARAKTVMVQGLLGVKRYVAYSSDVGETLRPIITPGFVTASYVVAGVYIVSDAVWCAYHEYDVHGASVADARLTLVHALIFQGVASLLIPMYTIHFVVHTAADQFNKMKRFQRWGPSVCGFVCIPFLPLIDEPVEHAVDFLFESVGFLPVSRLREQQEKHDDAHKD